MTDLNAIMFNAIRYRLTLDRVHPGLFREDVRWLLGRYDAQAELLEEARSTACRLEQVVADFSDGLGTTTGGTIAGMDEIE